MSLQPLFEIQEIFYPVLMLLLNTGYKSEQRKDPELNIMSKIGKVKGKPLWGVRVDIKTPDNLEPTSFPYTFAISVYGRFLREIPLLKEIGREAYLHQKKLIYVNGSTMLYSAARDRLMLLTGGNYYPPYCLPTYRFNPEDIKK